MVSPPLKGSDLLEWRRRLLADGGHAADLDWLLDLAAGLRWQDLQRLQLDPAGVELTLDCSLDALEQQWLLHRQRQIPCSIWWAAVPGVIWNCGCRPMR